MFTRPDGGPVGILADKIADWTPEGAGTKIILDGAEFQVVKESFQVVTKMINEV